MFKRILGIICIIISISALIATYIQNATTTSKDPRYILIVSALFAFLAYRIFSSDKRKAKREKRKEQREESLKTANMKHINGLPIAENTFCSIKLTDDKFIFSSGTMHFELDKSKITDICIQTDREIQQQYVSSAGGAIGGAMLFGSLGAIIGGRAKKKTVKNEVTHYLIITYQSDGIKYIGFEIGFNMAKANTFVKDFRNSHTAESTYQL